MGVRSFLARSFAILLASQLTLNCIAALALKPSDEDGHGRHWLLLLFGRGGPRDISSPPTIRLTEGVNYPVELIEVSPSAAISVPERVEGAMIPIGQVYDVRPAYNRGQIQLRGHLMFGGTAELHYTYDAHALAAVGLVPEFNSFFWSEFEQDWRPAERTSAPELGRVLALTDHLTPFLLTASSGDLTELPAPPECITADFAGGIGGSGGAVLTTVGDGTKFYRDRTYRIVGDVVWKDLGLEGALALATCNGGGACGTFSEHKHYIRDGYVAFQAPADLTVYVMYDAAGPADGSGDAAWLAAGGFQNTGRVVSTSAPGGRFRVYARNVARGTSVSLGGNRQGAGSGAIENNYWLALKRQGEVGSVQPGTICQTPGPIAGALSPGNLRALPGQDRVRLIFDPPVAEGFASVVIRRSSVAPPASVSAGSPVTNLPATANSHLDTGLDSATTYFYSAFALYDGSDARPFASVRVRTGVDSDSDGLSDVFERDLVPSQFLGRTTTGEKLLPNNADTDGDGVADGTELATGTDPTNPDSTPPAITAFSRTSPSPATFPVVTFDLSGTDNTGIVGWQITESATPPRPDAPGWMADVPTTHALKTPGSRDLYAWAKDAAGNVNGAQTISVSVPGFNIPLFAYATHGATRKVVAYRIDPATGGLTPFQEQVLDTTAAQDVALHPSGHLVVIDQTHIWSFPLDLANGNFDPNPASQAALAGFSGRGIEVPPGGGFLYAFGGSSIARYSLNPATGQLEQVSTTGAGTEIREVSLAPDGSFGVYLFGDVWSGFNYDVRPACYDQCCANIEFGCWNLGIYSWCLTSCTRTHSSPNSSVFDSCYANCCAGEQWMCDGGVGPFEGCLASCTAQQAAVLLPETRARIFDGTLNPTWTTGSTRGTDAYSGAVVDPAGSRAYFGRADSGGSIRAHTATGQAVGTVPAGGAPGRMRIRPDGQFLYVVVDGSRVNVFGLDANGAPVSTGSSGSGDVGTISGITIDSTGNYLYVPIASSNQIRVFRIDQTTGALTAGPVVATENTPNAVAVRSQHSVNAPPIANAGVTRWIQVGQRAAMSGARSVDPDRYGCSANTDNYRYAWRVAGVPAGSAVALGGTAFTDADGINASFLPDVAGDYTIQFSMTDDPGSCGGEPRTSTASVTIRAGYLRRSATQKFSISAATPRYPNTAPNQDAHWVPVSTGHEFDGFDISAMLVWELDVIGWLGCQYGISLLMEAGGAMCGQVASYASMAAGDPFSGYVAGMAAGAACNSVVNYLVGQSVSCASYYGWRILFPYCVSNFLEQSEAYSACHNFDATRTVYRNVAKDGWLRVSFIGAHHFWALARRTVQHGYWEWWSYTP